MRQFRIVLTDTGKYIPQVRWLGFWWTYDVDDLELPIFDTHDEAVSFVRDSRKKRSYAIVSEFTA